MKLPTTTIKNQRRVQRKALGDLAEYAADAFSQEPQERCERRAVREADVCDCDLLSIVKVLGLRSYRNKISWAVVDGTDKATAAVVAHRSDEAPAGTRGEQLKWIRDEVTDLINEHDPDSVVLCPTEGSAVSNAILERCQADGVIMEVAHSIGKTLVAKKAATIRSNYGATSNATLLLAVNAFAAVKDIAPTAARREPAIAALSGIP